MIPGTKLADSRWVLLVLVVGSFLAFGPAAAQKAAPPPAKVDPIRRLLSQARDTRTTKVAAARKENAEAEKRRHKWCHEQWPQYRAGYDNDYGRWMNWCTKESFAPPHDSGEIDLLDKYYAGITREYLEQIQSIMDEEFMAWWAESGSLSRSPLRHENGRLIALTPLQLAREHQQEQERAREEYERLVNRGARMGPIEVGGDGGAKKERRVSLTERDERLDQPLESAVFLPRGFYYAMMEYTRTREDTLHAPERADEFPAGHNPARASLEERMASQEVLYRSRENEERPYVENEMDCTHHVQQVIGGISLVSAEEARQIHMNSLKPVSARNQAAVQYQQDLANLSAEVRSRAEKEGAPGWAATSGGTTPMAGAPGMLARSGKGKAVRGRDAMPGDVVQYWWKEGGEWKGHAGIIAHVEWTQKGPVAYLHGAHKSAGRVTQSKEPVPLNSQWTFIGRIHPELVRSSHRSGRPLRRPPATREWHHR